MRRREEWEGMVGKPFSRAAVTFPAGGDHLRLARRRTRRSQMRLAAMRNNSSGGGDEFGVNH